MKSMNTQAIRKNEELQRQISRDVAEFVMNGGVIQKIEFGKSATVTDPTYVPLTQNDDYHVSKKAMTGLSAFAGLF